MRRLCKCSSALLDSASHDNTEYANIDTMPLAPAVSAPARQTMRAAFEKLERTVTPADSRAFRSTTLLQVRTTALELENQLAARQALCNLRRLAPLLNGLEHYSKAVDVLCNGTPFLPWIWAPITLILRVASEYVEAFEQIMKGYSKVGCQTGIPSSTALRRAYAVGQPLVEYCSA